MRSLATVAAETQVRDAHAAPDAAATGDQAPSSLGAVHADARFDAGIVSTAASRATLVAGLASLVWLALAAAVIYLVGRYHPVSALTLTDWAGIAAGVAAPLTAIWLAALIFARASRDSQRDLLARIESTEAQFAAISARTRQELDALDGVLGAVNARVEALRLSIAQQSSQLLDVAGTAEARTAGITASLASQREALSHASAQLLANADAARGRFDELMAALPGAERQAAGISAALESSAAGARRQVEEVETLLAAVWARNEDAESQAREAAARLTAALAAIESASGSAATGLEQRTAALSSSVDEALARTAEALEATRSGVEAQGAALAASVDHARVALDQIGGEASRAIAKRLEKLLLQADALTQRLNEQDARSRTLVDTIERSFSVLEAKLLHAAQSSGGTLDKLGDRLTQIREQIHQLAVPLGGTQEATREIEAAVAQLPGNLGRAGEAMDAVRTTVATLTEELNRLEEDAARVAAPVTQSQAAVLQIAEQLERARALIGEVEGQTEASTFTSSTKLIEALTRVREVAQQTAGTMRTTLDGVIAEAREALTAASEATVRQSFAEPIQAQIEAVEAAGERSVAAAQSAAERLSRQLLMVTEMASAVEARINEAERRLEEAAREDLSRRSNLLLESLNSASIDIAKLLSTEVTDTAWAAYLRGDRSIFTRRAVKLLDGGTAREIARHYEADPEFREQVRRYVHDFEAMMRRVMADREGANLSVALLSSDVGKLYVALAQAIDRLRS